MGEQEYNPTMDFIIDGYNLIFQCGLQTRAATDGLLQKARHRLVHEILARVPQAMACKITIVYDAAERPLLARGNSEAIGGIKIYYADQYDDADSMIEHLIAKHSVPRKLTVVSSDHRLHKAAMRRKAIPVDSDVWFDQLMEGKFSGAGQGGKKNQHDQAAHDSKSVQWAGIDWHAELGADDVDLSSIQGQLEAEDAVNRPSADAPPGQERIEEGCEPEPETPFNPFPPGYGEDLLE